MKKIVALLLSVFCILGLTGCAKKNLRFDINGADKITIFSGTNGEKAEITDASTIDRITNQFNTVSFSRDTSSKGHDGYRYQITWYDADGKQAELVTVMSATRISYNGYFYDVMEVGYEIDLDFIEELMGADTSGTYEVVVSDPKNYLYEQPDQFYPQGERVVIKAHILYDVALECFINGVSIGKQTTVKTGDKYTHWEFYFEMPAEDVTVTFAIADGISW